MTKSTRPVSRETSAFVRERGLRSIIVTITGGVIELRAKGLRSREVLDVAFCYHAAIKQRVASEQIERKAKKKARF